MRRNDSWVFSKAAAQRWAIPSRQRRTRRVRKRTPHLEFSIRLVAIDQKGERLFPRSWNEEFIDAPVVNYQKQPRIDEKGMERILKKAVGQYHVLYALLAGCGPLCAEEALGLEIDKHISEDCRTLYVRQKAKRGEIQEYTKTTSGTGLHRQGEVGQSADTETC